MYGPIGLLFSLSRLQPFKSLSHTLAVFHTCMHILMGGLRVCAFAMITIVVMGNIVPVLEGNKVGDVITMGQSIHCCN